MLPTAFTKTLRTLERSSPVSAIVRLAIAVTLLSGIAYWMLRVPVALYETSSEARLEIDSSTATVQAAMTGRVVESALAMGKVVKAGDILVRMDSLPEELLVREAKTRLSTVQPQIEALRAQIAEEEAAGVAEQRASASSVEEARLKIREAETPAKAAQVERRRYERLKKEGLAPDREVEKAIAEADRLDQVVNTARAAIERLEREQKTRDQQRLVRIAGIRTEITKLETSKANAQVSIERTNYDVERRVIRAPVGGMIGEAPVLRPGSVLQEGARVASIVPDGHLRIVAYFPSRAAFGRLQSGAPAKLRLTGYPWTEFGVVEAKVSNVAGEDRDGRARVELEVLDSPTLKTKMRHGMPGELEVEVEKTPPASLALRMAGQWLTAVKKP